MSSAKALVVLGLGGALARRFHDEQNHKHAHTYLQFCANPTTSYSHACIHKVSAKWPQPAVLDPQECKESAPPHSAVGTTEANCAGTVTGFNIYDPITIPTGLMHPNVDFRRGSDTDKLSDWDRIRCKDGQLFATGWYRKYTPMECARLCSKIHNFYGKSCTHFSRQWINTKVPEHSDVCGRDGETLPTSTPAHGAWASAGTGTGSYTYRGQCVFFNSANNECCATKAAWREEDSNMDSNYCTAKYGDRQDAWDSKHRSWRLKTQAFTPTVPWPVTSLGRRLSEEANGVQYDGESAEMHEIFFPNGTRFWVEDGEAPAVEAPTQKRAALDPAVNAAESYFIIDMWRQLWHTASNAWGQLWS